MKTVFFLLLSLGISASALYTAANMSNPFPVYGLVLSIWVLFYWSYTRRSRRIANRRFRENMFQEYMRSTMHNQRP
ncbi:hypothetical protein [Pedobacter panaciterrae]|uniref:Uncharacterized protein n=1 Tax=Pedobacter panaciterrae TaxID=363849 RepID=A0ABU8NH17_9SPHI|nr:hypothetical protein [Pedobacter panaciterrae]NQX56969.1 hypothetical protein [Pedobacter panaciterrae]